MPNFSMRGSEPFAPPLPEMARSEGYVLLATEHRKYYEMACNLARSIRFQDPSRPIALICDESLVTDDRIARFDRIVLLPRRDRFVGVLNKLRLFEVSPFERSLFVDGDCLMMRSSVSPYWQSFTGGCNTLGQKLTEGQWKGLDIRTITREIGTDYLVKMNAGVIFFDRSPLSEHMFEYMIDLFGHKAAKVSTIHQNRPGQYSMEPILGAAMARFGVEPMSLQPRAGSLMVSTLDARHIRASLQRGVVYLEKPHWRTRLRINVPGAALWTAHAPIFLHFIGLKPRPLYESLVTELAATE